MTRGMQIVTVVTLLTLAIPVTAQGRFAVPTVQVDQVQVLDINGAPVGTPVEPHAGEICMICNNPISGNDFTYLVQGQRVPVHRNVCDGKLRANPREILAGLRPRGAFLGAEMGKPGLSKGWFAFGAYILLGLIFGALCAQRALLAGRNSVSWFLAGLAFNVAGYGVLRFLSPRTFGPPAGIPAGLGKIANTYSPATCPKCSLTIHPSATSCPACGAALQPGAVSEVALTMSAH